MQNSIGDINKRIDELEPLQKKDGEYYRQLQSEINIVNQRILIRQGAIDELKRLVSFEKESK